MKKRSMLAIASLATGFVVAAVTPSHAAAEPGEALISLDVDDALRDLGSADKLIADDSLAVDKPSLGGNKAGTGRTGQKGHAGQAGQAGQGSQAGQGFPATQAGAAPQAGAAGQGFATGQGLLG